jgi:DHA1 family inner membrane transport protein
MDRHTAVARRSFRKAEDAERRRAGSRQQRRAQRRDARAREPERGAASGGAHRGRAVAAVLFLSLFAAQAAVIVLSPVLASVAADLDVSTAAAGQLRTLSGLAAGMTALAVPRVSRVLGLRALMLCGLALIAFGSLVSAGAPSFAVLALAQVVLGVAIAGVVAGGTAAAAAWAPEGQRTRVLSWALIGQPAAWIVGMPLVGALGERSWRLGWIVLPLVAAAVAAAAVARRPGDTESDHADPRVRSALARPPVARWATAELLANCGWAGTLVYAGALFTESYDASGGLTGAILAVGAAAFVAGNLTARRSTERRPRRQLVLLALSLGVAVPLFGAVRVGTTTSALLFALAAFAAGGRTLLGNVVGLELAPEHRLAAMGIRTATTQFGYFAGAGAAGLALGAAGYTGLGLTLGAFFVCAALALVEPRAGVRAVVTTASRML